LVELLWAVIERHGDLPALFERDGERLTRVTFAELSRAVAALSQELCARGVGRGDVVGVWLPNWIETIVWEFALAARGAAMLGVNTRYGIHELTHLLDRGRLAGVVAPARFLDLDFAGRLRAALAASESGLPWVAVVRPAGTECSSEFVYGGETWTPSPVCEAATCPDDIHAAGVASDPVNYFTTSGSTGLPKLAGHNQSSVATHSANVARALDMRANDCFLGVLPLSGVFGFNPTMAILSVGGTCLLEPVFDPELVLRDAGAVGVTHVVGGDDMLGRLMDAWYETDPDRRPELRRLRRGGIADFAGRVGAVITWAAREWGASLSGVYGSSELFALASIWPSTLEQLERRRGGGMLVSADLSVRVVDSVSGSLCRPGSTGELQFQGYNVPSAYLGDRGALDTAFTEDRWFRSGDLGFVLEQPGSFVYTCRAGDALRLRGFLVEPAEIERFLGSHPDVATAKVVGVPSAAGAEVAVAYVQLATGATATSDDLISFCRERLAAFKVPAFVNVIAQFPVTTGTNGTKIRTAELRRWAEEQIARSGRPSPSPAAARKRKSS
jgi:acyl-CoA synthetase (AMP-forming)/AMP-acid ligase II